MTHIVFITHFLIECVYEPERRLCKRTEKDRKTFGFKDTINLIFPRGITYL